MSSLSSSRSGSYLYSQILRSASISSRSDLCPSTTVSSSTSTGTLTDTGTITEVSKSLLTQTSTSPFSHRSSLHLRQLHGDPATSAWKTWSTQTFYPTYTALPCSAGNSTVCFCNFQHMSGTAWTEVSEQAQTSVQCAWRCARPMSGSNLTLLAA